MIMSLGGAQPLEAPSLPPTMQTMQTRESLLETPTKISSKSTVIDDQIILQHAIDKAV